jgi:hypothetical protein
MLTAALAEVPGRISYQGTLTDAYGVALDTTVAMTFSIYSDSTGLTSVWGEVQPAVEVNDGIFNVLLGSVNPISESVFPGSRRWLGIQVSSDPEMSPLQELASVGHAFHAAAADTAKYALGAPMAESYWSVTDSVLYTNLPWGLAKGGADNVLYGLGAYRHVNLGIACTTGTMGLNRNGCTVGGGWGNHATDSYATVSGGLYNVVNAGYGVVAGGYDNTVSGTQGFVGGGWTNIASGAYTTVSGGYANVASGERAVVAGGHRNVVLGDRSAILGGWADTIAVGADYSYLFGVDSKLTQDSTFAVDMPHILFGDEATGYEIPTSDGTSGQIMVTDGSGQVSWSDLADDNDWVRGTPDSVLFTAHKLGIARGGSDNVLNGTNIFTHVNLGIACTTGTAGLNRLGCTVGGGWGNHAYESYATVAGGLYNISYGAYAAIAGGYDNTASGTESVVGGGGNNIASGAFTTVGGGYYNVASGERAVVAGGHRNVVLGDRSAILGGSADTIAVGADYSYLFGVDSKLTQDSTFAVDMPHILFGDEATGYEMPTSDGSSGQIMVTDGGGQVSWSDVADDNDWVRGTPDSVLFTANKLGIARGGSDNVLHGANVFSHVNLGIACTTGIPGLNRTGCTLGGGWGNHAYEDYVTVAGGYKNTGSGAYAAIAGGYNNTVSGIAGAVGGGETNAASGNYASVGGGYQNVASGPLSVVSGGWGNIASNYCAAVGGGYHNTASQEGAIVTGGYVNTASGYYAFVGGGYGNHAIGDYSAILGGAADTITATADYSYLFGLNSKLTQDSTFAVDMPHILFGDEATGYEMPPSDGTNGQVMVTDGLGQVSWGDVVADNDWVRGTPDSVLFTANYLGIARGSVSNQLYGTYVYTHNNLGVACTTGSAGQNYFSCTVSGGVYNVAGNEYAVVAGGRSNRAGGNDATVSGGRDNTASDGGATVAGGVDNTASSYFTAVGGGAYNTASGNSAIVAGGVDNTAGGTYAFVGGGYGNSASNSYSTVNGGRNNTATEGSATVAGGYYNASSGLYSTVSGGYFNAAGGSYATVAGGYRDTSAAAYSFTAGSLSQVDAAYVNSAAFNGQTATAMSQTRVGALSKVSGTFTIDHPLDPMNKILNHYFVESPEMVLIYRGAAVLDANGRAAVSLPDYFDALNENPMVQLTGVGTFEVFVAEEVRGNGFVIGGKPGAKVYWTVTGGRKDPSAEITEILMPVEQPKEGSLVGRSLDDDFLATTMMQLQRMGQGGRFSFRTQQGRARYEEFMQGIEASESLGAEPRD